jgi:hypothetical protein
VQINTKLIDVVFAFIAMTSSGKTELPEKDRACSRSVNLYVTCSAVRILNVLIVLWTGWLIGAHAMVNTVTRQAKLIDLAKPQKTRI